LQQLFRKLAFYITGRVNFLKKIFQRHLYRGRAKKKHGNQKFLYLNKFQNLILCLCKFVAYTVGVVIILFIINQLVVIVLAMTGNLFFECPRCLLCAELVFPGLSSYYLNYLFFVSCCITLFLFFIACGCAFLLKNKTFQQRGTFLLCVLCCIAFGLACCVIYSVFTEFVLWRKIVRRAYKLMKNLQADKDTEAFELNSKSEDISKAIPFKQKFYRALRKFDQKYQLKLQSKRIADVPLREIPTYPHQFCIKI
jgi:hypothetical protein